MRTNSGVLPAATDDWEASDISNAEIAQELYISDTTVKTHVTHVVQKLNLRDRVQVVVLAYQAGLYETDARPPSGRGQSPTS